jgi:hypothetical protein
MFPATVWWVKERKRMQIVNTFTSVLLITPLASHTSCILCVGEFKDASARSKDASARSCAHTIAVQGLLRAPLSWPKMPVPIYCKGSLTWKRRPGRTQMSGYTAYLLFRVHT